MAGLGKALLLETLHNCFERHLQAGVPFGGGIAAEVLEIAVYETASRVDVPYLTRRRVGGLPKYHGVRRDSGSPILMFGKKKKKV